MSSIYFRLGLAVKIVFKGIYVNMDAHALIIREHVVLLMDGALLSL